MSHLVAEAQHIHYSGIQPPVVVVTQAKERHILFLSVLINKLDVIVVLLDPVIKCRTTGPLDAGAQVNRPATVWLGNLYLPYRILGIEITRQAQDGMIGKTNFSRRKILIVREKDRIARLTVNQRELHTGPHLATANNHPRHRVVNNNGLRERTAVGRTGYGQQVGIRQLVISQTLTSDGQLRK